MLIYNYIYIELIKIVCIYITLLDPVYLEVATTSAN